MESIFLGFCQKSDRRINFVESSIFIVILINIDFIIIIIIITS